MFGKTKGKTANDGRVPASVQQFERLPGAPAGTGEAPDSISSISAEMTIVGKIAGTGTVKVFGRIEGELRASTVLIADGAQVEGDIVAEDVTIGGRLKGTVHADRVRLNGSAIVQGDIFHRSLAIEENARFEGSSRREDNAVDPPSRTQGSRAQPPAVVQDGRRKLNGTPDKSENEAQASPAA